MRCSLFVGSLYWSGIWSKSKRGVASQSMSVSHILMQCSPDSEDLVCSHRIPCCCIRRVCNVRDCERQLAFGRDEVIHSILLRRRKPTWLTVGVDVIINVCINQWDINTMASTPTVSHVGLRRRVIVGLRRRRINSLPLLVSYGQGMMA